MRRFASVFTSSRRDKNERNEKNLKRATSVNLNVVTQPFSSDTVTFDSTLSTPQLSAGSSEPAHSSASSAGSASFSLQTPDDLPTSQAKTTKTWIPWLTKKSGTIKAARRPESRFTPQPPPLLRNPPPGNRAPTSSQSDSDSDSESDEYDEEDDSHPINGSMAKPILTPDSPSKSRDVLQSLTRNSLIDRPYPSPFVVQPGRPLYPRSCNRPRFLPSERSLASTVLKRRLLERLQDPNPTRSEAESILAFSTRSVPQALSVDVPVIDEKALSASERTAMFSVGLRSWVHRPPFEDRFSVWTAVDGNVTCQRISGASGFALAALEFSEAIEAKADIYGQPLPSLQPALELPVPSSSPSDIPSSASSASSHMSTSASHTRSNPSPQLVAPSPLRNQASTLSSRSSNGPSNESAFQLSSPTSSPSGLSPVSSRPSPSPTSPTQTVDVPSPTSSSGTIKRGVRFADDDKDENIPIGYVMRVKKQREEKARFLREQKERRMFEEERAQADEERKQREAERQKWEQEKMAWEKEKRAIEEERRRKRYAEEVVAARQRAESSRMGMRSSSAVSLQDAGRNTQESQRYSPIAHDASSTSRKQASDPSPRDSYFVSSRPPSIASGAGPYAATSRPPSVYTISSEDLRHRPQSITSHSSSKPRPERASTYVGSNLSLIPPVPPIPMLYPPGYGMDMPLLPPTAPFMVNQYSRRHSQSPQGSSRQRVSSNSSSESVNRQSVHARQSTSSAGRGSTSSSPSQSPHRTHRRRTSDDNTRRLSTYSSSHSPSSPHSPPASFSRGRLMHPTSVRQSLPSPWTAPPTQTGRIPMAMPSSDMATSASHGTMNSVTRHTPSRRQTTFS